MSDPMLRPLFNTHAQIACIGELQTREVKHLQRIAVLEKALSDGPKMMFQYGKAIHLKSVGLYLEANQLRNECLAWETAARTALAGTGKDDKCGIM